jgi:hypothetical protein
MHYELITKRTMGYLKDFRESFAKRLDALDPEEMKEALNVACNALLESYRNGQKSVQEEARKKRDERRTGDPSAEKRPRRAWKKRTT